MEKQKMFQTTNQLGYGVFGYSFSAWSFPLIQSSSKVGFLILQLGTTCQSPVMESTTTDNSLIIMTWLVF